MAITVGTAGNDTLVGVKGEDNLIHGDPDSPGGSFIGGNDTIIGGANSNNTLVGDESLMDGLATGGERHSHRRKGRHQTQQHAVLDRRPLPRIRVITADKQLSRV
jgi:hypothetical protein